VWFQGIKWQRVHVILQQIVKYCYLSKHELALQQHWRQGMGPSCNKDNMLNCEGFSYTNPKYVLLIVLRTWFTLNVKRFTWTRLPYMSCNCIVCATKLSCPWVISRIRDATVAIWCHCLLFSKFVSQLSRVWNNLTCVLWTDGQSMHMLRLLIFCLRYLDCKLSVISCPNGTIIAALEGTTCIRQNMRRMSIVCRTSIGMPRLAMHYHYIWHA
jgi:hypothetical protein